MREVLARLPALRFGFEEENRAWNEWRFSCGPAAICAVLGLTPEELRPYLPGFPGWMSPSKMVAALDALGARSSDPRKEWPELGVVRIQWIGPGSTRAFRRQQAYRHTHWVACHWPRRKKHDPAPAEPHHIFDVNAAAWLPFVEWDRRIVPLMIEGRKGATGEWDLTHGYEVRRPDVFAAPPAPVTAPECKPVQQSLFGGAL